MTARSSLLASLLFLSLNFSCGEVYSDFLQCLSRQTKQDNKISTILYTPTNTSYYSVLRGHIRNARFNQSSTPKPTIIITPESDSHVQATVICTKEVGYQLKIRSGGHDFDGLSYISNKPFFILDMFNLRKIFIDIQNQTAVVQVGATLGELYYNIWQKSKTHGFPAGIVPTVGIGGHFSGGGYGNMLRKHGLSVDHIFDAQIVDVNGNILDRNMMGEDLFWAIRGGGGASFGVIISYSINLVSVPETVTVFQVVKTLEESNRSDFVVKWQSVAPLIDSNLYMSPELRVSKTALKVKIKALYLGNAISVVTLLGKEFPELELKRESCVETSWIGSALWWAGYTYKSNPEVLLKRSPDKVDYIKRKSDYVQEPISKQNWEDIMKKQREHNNVHIFFIPYGGRMAEIDWSETPFPHRKGNLFKIHYGVNWYSEGKELEDSNLKQIRMMYSDMTPFVSKNPRSVFLNYRDVDIGVMPEGGESYEAGKVYGEKYFNGNFERLVRVKTAVDPQNFFAYEQSIPTKEH